MDTELFKTNLNKVAQEKTIHVFPKISQVQNFTKNLFNTVHKSVHTLILFTYFLQLSLCIRINIFEQSFL